jgi:predicted N-formylglutamate amidohydrolase
MLEIRNDLIASVPAQRQMAHTLAGALIPALQKQGLDLAQGTANAAAH